MFKTHKGGVSSDAVRAALGGSADVREERVLLGGFPGKAVTLFYIDGLVSSAELSENIIQPLTDAARFPKELALPAALELSLHGLVYGSEPKRRDAASDAVDDVLSGSCAVVFDSEGAAVTIPVHSPDKRSVDLPKEEKVVKGSKDSFVETLSVNTSLIRKKLKNPKLRFVSLSAGGLTNTELVLSYIEGYTSQKLIDELTRRLSSIKAEGIISASVITENLVETPSSPFPRVITTERPDKFVLNLIEGRVGLLADGLPMGFLLPASFSQFMKAPEDNSGHWLMSSFLTLLRYFSFIIASIAPAFYVAVAMYHREMIPVKLMQSMVDAKAFVPFPTAVEVIGMLIAFDLLQEAGIRLPTPVGQTVSIIGGLIVGQSAVEAKVVSPVVVVVIALSGIAGYTMPDQDMSAAVRIVRFSLTLAAALLGAFGVALAASLWIWHISGLDSLGTPYMSPFAGNNGKHTLRALLRFPMGKKREREPELLEEDHR